MKQEQRIGFDYKKAVANEYCFMIILFLASVLIRFVIADFPKSLTVYDDELLYTQIAQSLSEGLGILVHNVPTSFQTILYSLMIAPAYLVSQPELTIRIIALLNCIMMSAIVFSAYGLAKKSSQHFLGIRVQIMMLR